MFAAILAGGGSGGGGAEVAALPERLALAAGATTGAGADMGGPSYANVLWQLQPTEETDSGFHRMRIESH